MIRIASTTWLAAICALTLLLFMGIRIDWAGSGPPSASLRKGTPLQTMDTMRVLARQNDWKEYWQCFSTRGKAWYICSFYFTTAWAAFAYPGKRPPEAFEAERILDRYGFTKSRMERQEAESLQSFHERVSHYLDGREIEFWGQFGSDKRWLLPGDGEIRILSETDNFALLQLPMSPDGIECGAVKVGGQWLFDGSEYK
jgi:hypothetical protein